MCWRYRITSPLLSVTVNTVQMVGAESKLILQLWRLQLYFVQSMTKDLINVIRRFFETSFPNECFPPSWHLVNYKSKLCN